MTWWHSRLSSRRGLPRVHAGVCPRRQRHTRKRPGSRSARWARVVRSDAAVSCSPGQRPQLRPGYRTRVLQSRRRSSTSRSEEDHRQHPDSTGILQMRQGAAAGALAQNADTVAIESTRRWNEVCDHLRGRADMDYLTIDGCQAVRRPLRVRPGEPCTDDQGVGLDQTPLRVSAVDDRRGVPGRRPGAVRRVRRHRFAPGRQDRRPGRRRHV